MSEDPSGLTPFSRRFRDGALNAILERMGDDVYLEPYLAVIARVSELARNDAPSLDRTVPACPEWTARDVISHLAGLAQDWAAGNLNDYGSDAWAGAQARRFEGQSLDDVLSAWAVAATQFSDMEASPIGGTAAMWAFGDAVVHEADLRAVLATGTRLPDAAMTLGLKGGLARWRTELGAAGAPPLDIVARDVRSWRVGDPDAAAESVTTTGHELFRAMFGRRSRAQVEAWEWSCDPAVYLDIELPYPFRWAATAIED